MYMKAAVFQGHGAVLPLILHVSPVTFEETLKRLFFRESLAGDARRVGRWRGFRHGAVSLGLTEAKGYSAGKASPTVATMRNNFLNPLISSICRM